jgi:predicted AAA+ superfamily ATPase
MLVRTIHERIARSRTSILLLGPRQVGKSTLCRALSPTRMIDLADERRFLELSKEPGRLRDELRAIPRDSLVCIDKVQRIPSLLNVVQSIIDDPGNELRFILTGSSARKLKRRNVNLLPGRLVLEHLDPLSYFELADAVDMERAPQLGTLPGIYLGSAEASRVLETYCEVYLREEIRGEALARNTGGYARFLDAAAIMSGSWLNYSKLASDAEIPKETVRRYVSVLEDTLLLFRIPSSRPRLRLSRRVSQRDRVFLFDVGVRNALLGLHRHPTPRNQVGTLFEQWFMLQTIYLNRAAAKGSTTARENMDLYSIISSSIVME